VPASKASSMQSLIKKLDKVGIEVDEDDNW
jgi:hypothetical protein